MVTDEYVDSLIANLKVLSSVPNGGRLCVRKGNLSVESALHGQCVFRFIYGDSRDTTIAHVKNAVAGAVQIAQSIMTNSAGLDWNGAWVLERLSSEMERCETGLRNLRATYSTDTSTIAALQVLSERLAAHHAQIVQFLRGGRHQGAAESPPFAGGGSDSAPAPEEGAEAP